jgi:hypothetical protein
MSVVRHLQTGFMAGELDPYLDGRIDTQQYAFGLSTCENWIPLSEGPLVKRQGFAFVREAAPSASWLTAFRRSIDQEYALEWSDNALRFFTLGGRLETSPGTAYQVATPYAASEAPQLSQQQSYDRLYFNHGDHPPAALRRDSTLAFAFETLVLENGPFLNMNTDEALVVSASGTTGAITLTGSAGVFSPGRVGGAIRLEARDFAVIPQWEPGMKDVAVGQKVRNRGKVYVAASGGTTGSVEPEHIEGTYYDGQNKKDLLNDKGPYGVRWTYVHDRFGIARINSVTGNTAGATVERTLPDSIASGTYRWAHQAFSEAEGWPSLVTLYKGRRVDFKDLYVIGSVVDDYGGGRVNYSTHTVAGELATDLGFRRTIASEDPPLWVSNDRKLLVGTASQELAIGAANSGAGFSGENIEAEPQSYYGSELVMPVRIATETIFVERGGRRLRSADYDFGRDRYDAPDLTATARHITQSGIVQLAYQRVPFSLVHAVRGDGQIVVHPKTRSEIKGLARIRLGGGARALSGVSIVGEDRKTDDLWLLVERENGAGATVREIWKQEAWRELGTDQKQAFFVDGGVRIAASAGDGHFTGLGHLAGQAVAVLANGFVITGLSVDAAGELDLPAQNVPAYDYTVIVGLAYRATATTMRPEIRSDGGSSAGLRQRLIKVALRMLDSLGIKVSVPGGVTEEIIDRRGGQSMDEPVPLFSGDSDGLVEAEYDRDGRASWISEVPLPATVALAALNVDVSWRDE